MGSPNQQVWPTEGGPAAASWLRVFISYGHDEHAALARRLRQDLRTRGHDARFDEDFLQPGCDWETRLEAALDWVSAVPGEGRVILLMTPHSVRRPDGYCLNEVARALARRVTVVPVMVVFVEPPLSICRIQWLDMRDCIPVEQREERYANRFEYLAQILEAGQVDAGGKLDRLRRALDPLPFEAEIALHLQRFTGREWLIRDIDAWLADPRASRIFWVTGKPGVGKTAMVAWLCARRREVAAFHLCRHGHVHKSDPRRCVLSLAYQLATQLPAYLDILGAMDLEGIIPESNAATLFDRLIVQPLAEHFPRPDRTVVVVIDALDEATRGGKNELASFLASDFLKTPEWLRLVVTSRPELAVATPLQNVSQHLLDNRSLRNKEDLQAFLARELKPYAGGADVPPATIEAILAQSEGIFLYAEWVRQELAMGRLLLGRLDEFPAGLAGVYAQFFDRQFPDIGVYKGRIRPALELVAAAQEPLELARIGALLGWDEYAAHELCTAMGSLFPVTEGFIQPFHRSVMDWLTDKARAGHYFVNEKIGHSRLADQGISEYREGVGTMSPHLLAHLPIHLVRAERWRDLETVLADPTFIDAKCAKGMTYALVADIGAAARADHFTPPMAQAMVKQFETRLLESLRQQLRGALSEFFGQYRDWPDLLREALEKSQDTYVTVFLGDTHVMELRPHDAMAVFRRMKDRSRGRDDFAFATACNRMGYIHEQEDRISEGLHELNEVIGSPNAEARYGFNYWWALYLQGILLRRSGEYGQAKDVLGRVRASAAGSGLPVSALHQLGNIDLELGDLNGAQEEFFQCEQERGESEFDHRRAYEPRRLGQVYALTGHPEEAGAAFDRSIAISQRAANWRYVGLARQDILKFLKIPDCLMNERPKFISLDQLARRFSIDVKKHEAQLSDIFRVLARRHLWYLDVVDAESGQPTGQVVRWDVAHREGVWHASVVLLVADCRGHIAVQRRGEADSQGKWDASVAGHQDVGESDVLSAVREAREEISLSLDPERMTRVAEAHQFLKIGSPDIACDKHEGRFAYKYHTEGRTNRERVSMFIVRLAEGEREHVIPTGEGGAASIDWLSLPETAKRAEDRPNQFASAFKHLMHPATLEEIHRVLGFAG
ncbi:MAG: TIR domain-containing protein [Planctomycetota bacterium]|nr:TIR domain-containing protein [Planctomycetota bacterium]